MSTNDTDNVTHETDSPQLTAAGPLRRTRRVAHVSPIRRKLTISLAGLMAGALFAVMPKRARADFSDVVRFWTNVVVPAITGGVISALVQMGKKFFVDSIKTPLVENIRSAMSMADVSFRMFGAHASDGLWDNHEWKVAKRSMPRVEGAVDNAVAHSQRELARADEAQMENTLAARLQRVQRGL